MRKTKASLLMLGVTAVAAALMLIPFAARSSERPVQVKTAVVQAGSVEQLLVLTGTLRYETEYAAISPATGVVAQVYVAAGQRVQAGQPLFRLEDHVQAAAVSAALAGQGEMNQALPVDLPALQLQEAAAALENLTVRAAADGLVQQVNVMPHAGVMAGSAAVALSSGKQVVRCQAVLRDAEKIHPGMQARILRDGEELTMARVAEIGPAQISTATGQTVCQVTLSLADSIGLPLGASMDVEVLLYGQEDVPVLPLEAITENSTVWWVADGRCHEIAVEPIMADEVNCWVNLPEGVRVVVQGDVDEGQRVEETE